MSKKHQLPALVVVLGLLYGGYLFYDFSSEVVPRLERDLASKESELSVKTAELRKLRSFSENIESIKLSLRELNLQLESALESMPRNYDLSGLLRKLSVVGFNSGVTLSAFRPGATPKKEGDFYETLDVAFNLAGSYTQMMGFFDQVLRLKRIVHLEKISIKSLASDQQATRVGTGASADVTAKLYRFVD